jgi:hypothetical protein
MKGECINISNDGLFDIPIEFNIKDILRKNCETDIFTSMIAIGIGIIRVLLVSFLVDLIVVTIEKRRRRRL